MKKKYVENSDEENEFDVDEPEEIQNNASDDDWTPDKDTSGGRRSSRLRNIPKSRVAIIDPSSTDEEDEGSDESQGSKRKAGKGRGRGRQPIKKHKVSSSTPTTTPIKDQSENNISKTLVSDSEPTSTTTNNSLASPTVVKLNKDFTSGAFVVLKTDAANSSQDPALWKIDGKALLQKYVPFEQDGKLLYKNTSVYSGWTINNKDNYYPVSVIFKQQTRKEHIVELHRDQIKLGYPEVSSSSAPEPIIKLERLPFPKESPKKPPVKPVIKVKSFAIAPDAEPKTPVTLIVPKIEKVDDTPTTPFQTPITPSQTTVTPSPTPMTPSQTTVTPSPTPMTPSQTTVTPSPTPTTPSLTPTTPFQTPLALSVIKINKNFSPGAFLVLRSEAANVDPPLWKIDGKALLQKYNPFVQNGKTLYKNCAEYSGWTMKNKVNYFPVSVIFKQQNKKDHIVELDRIKWDEPEDETGQDE